jgi:hypothetical protein
MYECQHKHHVARYGEFKVKIGTGSGLDYVLCLRIWHPIVLHRSTLIKPVLSVIHFASCFLLHEQFRQLHVLTSLTRSSSGHSM